MHEPKEKSTLEF